ncbi:hypothetical protein C8R44DRAFT_880738 [Mycena epipterygia]|nr:hypothetical protein C8R44DRAFT_880738 [Mycena epipterygia]
MVQPTGILDLPTEILVAILENSTFPTNTLYYLALLCRRLNIIALPIYFARHGMHSDSNSVVITMHTDRRDLVAALQIALFTPRIEHLTCIFPHPSCTSIFPILPHLRRLEHLISRLTSLRHVALHLDSLGSICLSVGDDAGLQAWTSHLQDLLNCIVRRQCRSLVIIGGAQFTKAYELGWTASHRSRIHRVLVPIRKRLCLRSDETYEFRRASKQGHSHVHMVLPSTSYRSSQLTSLNIQSAILIRPPGLQWTLAALRNCRTTSLILCFRVSEPIIWTMALPLIASVAPHLTTLVLLAAESLPDSDVLTFISRLPLLIHLTISSTNTTGIRYYRSPLIEFRTLESLRAPPNFIQHFQGHPACFPAIKSICISWPADYTSTVGSFAASTSSIVRALDARGLSPEFYVSVDTMMSRLAPMTQHLTADIRASLDRIQVLEIMQMPSFFTDMADIAAWVAIFPCIRRAEIALSKSTLADIRVKVDRLVRTIKATEFMDKIVVNGVVYDLLK